MMELMSKTAEEFYQELEIPYRIVNIVSGMWELKNILLFILCMILIKSDYDANHYYQREKLQARYRSDKE